MHATKLLGSKQARLVAFTMIALIMVLTMVLAMVRPAFAVSPVTPATGATGISIDTTTGTANGHTGSGTWTALGSISGPIITEGSIGDIHTGLHTLTLPAGWEFNTGQNITIGSNPESLIVLGASVVTPLAHTVSFNVITASSGVPATLTFSNLQVRPTGTAPSSGDMTMTLGTIAGVDGATNFGTFSTGPGVATHFAVTTSGGGTETAGVGFSVTSTAQDQFNNTVNGANGGANNYNGSKTANWTWTATASPAPLSVAPSKPGDGAQTYTNGVLNLGGFTLTRAGQTPTISVTDTTISGTSAAITVNPGAVVSLTITGSSPQTAGSSQVLTITAKDVDSNTATSYNGGKLLFFSGASTSPTGNIPTVSDNVATNNSFGDGTLVDFTNGVSTSAPSMKLYKAEAATIAVSDLTRGTGSLGGATLAVTVDKTTTDHLFFSNAAGLVSATAPGAQTAGSAFNVYVAETDVYGNLDGVATDAISLGGLAGHAPGNAPLGNNPNYDTPPNTAIGGVATFNVTLYAAETLRQLEATLATFTSATSAAFTVNPAAANHLAITTPPSGSVSGFALTGQPVVKALDNWDNIDTNYVTDVVASENDLGALTGTTTKTPVAGVATFTNLLYTATADNQTFQLEFDSGALPQIHSGDVVSDVIATKLIVNTQPSGSVSGIALTGQPVVYAVNAQDTVDADYVTDVVASENDPGALTGTTTKTPVAGVATFTDLLYTATVDQQVFQIDFASGAITGVTSGDVTSDVVATEIVIHTAPGAIISGLSMTQPVIWFVDAQGTVDAGVTGDVVTVTENGAGGFTAGATGVAAASGVVTYAGLVYTANADNESVTLTFTDDAGNVKNFSAAPKNSAALTAQVIATKLIVNTQPSGSVSGIALTGQPVVYAVNAQDTVDADYVTDVVASENDPGALTGTTTKTPVAGVATFTDLLYTATVDQQVFQIDFASGAISGVTSGDVTSDVVATEIVIHTAPGAIISGLSMTQPVIWFVDAQGTVDAGVTGDVVTVTENGAGGFTAGATGVAAASGVVTYAGLVYTANADNESVTLTFTDDAGNVKNFSAAPKNSAALTAQVIATKLIVNTQPSGSVSGIALTGQPVVYAVNAQDTVDADYVTDVVASENDPGALTGTTTKTPVAGVATFTDLLYTATVDQQVFQIDFASGAISGVTSGDVTSDVVATEIVIHTAPGAIISGLSMTQPVIWFVDAQGTVDAGVTGDVVTVTENGAGGFTAGATGVAAASGVVTYAGLVYTANADNESVTLTFTDDAGNVKNFSAAPKNSAALTAQVIATKLIVNTQPSGSVSGIALTGQPVVYAVNAQDTVDADYVTDVVASTNEAGSLTGTTTKAAIGGIATFNNLVYSATADNQNFEIDFASGAITGVSSNTISSNVLATVLAFDTAPGSVISGVSMTQPIVKYVNAQGITDVDVDADVLTIGENGAGGFTAGVLTATASNGVATFAGLVYSAAADNEAVTFSFTDDGGNLVDLSGTPLTSAQTANVVATKFVIINPIDGTVDAAVTVTVEAQNAQNLKDVDYVNDVTLNSDGASSGGGLIDIAAGTGTRAISDHTAETVNLTLTDSQGTGLNIASTQNVVFAAGAAHHFTIAGAAARVAGAANALTISAFDQYDNAVSSGVNNYTGDKALTFSGANDSPLVNHPTVTDKDGTATNFGTATTITFLNGVSSAGGSMVLYKTETANIAATAAVGGVTTPSALSVAVTPAVASYLKVTGTATMTAGTTNELTVGAYDAYGNLNSSGANDYNSPQTLTFSGPAAAGDGSTPSIEGTNIGVAMVGVAFSHGVTNGTDLTLTAFKAQSVTVNVTDGSVNSNAAGHGLALTVNPADPYAFRITGTATQTAGVGNNTIIVTAYDTYDNQSNYNGSLDLWFNGLSDGPTGNVPTMNGGSISSGGGSVAVATTFVNGVSTTVLTLTTYKAEIATLAVRAPFNGNDYGIDSWDHGVAGGLSITSRHAAPYNLTLVAPAGPQTAGTSFNMTSLTSKDIYGNIADGANGAAGFANGLHTITWQMTAGTPDGPTSGTDTYLSGALAVNFTSGTATTPLATILYRMQGGVIIKAHSADDAGIDANDVACTAFDVRHATAAALIVTAPAASNTGAAINVTIDAKDAHGNVMNTDYGASAYTGNIFMWSEAVSPTWYTPLYGFSGVELGHKVFTGAVAFNTVETIHVYARDMSTAITGTSGAIVVTVLDTTRPTVDSIYPVHGATGVATSVQPYVNFDGAMKPSTINSTTVQLKPSAGGAAIAATVTLAEGNNARALITPSVALSANTAYYIYVTTGVQDAAGNALLADFGSTGTSQFTTASIVTPTVTLIGAGVLPIYSVSAADTRFASGVQFTVTNDASITVNGASATSVAGTLTAASNAEAKTVGAHSYLVVVTSSTSQTASLQVTYQVVATTVTPSVTLSGAAIVSSYTATAALARFGGAGLQVTVSNGAGESVTVNGGAPAAQAGALVTVASIANAQTLGLHTYDIIVTSSTGNVVTLNITYTVTADVVTPTVTLIGAGVLPIYSVSAADTRFASGVQFTVTNDASITVNGASATSVAGTLTAASNAEAKTVGAHSYLVVVTSSTSQTASLQVTYQVVATTVTPSVTLSGAAIVSSYTATAALARFGGAGLQVTVSNGAGESVTVNGGAPAAQAGALVTVASIANAQTLGLHTYDIIVTSSTGNVVTLNITYTVTADVVTPTVTLIGAGVLPIYSVSAADTRFASGVQFTVTNDASITVNGASATSVAGTLTAASNAEAKTVGAHSYLVVVTSSTSQTASLQVTYQVVATTVTPSVTLSGAAIVSSYTATAALARFGGAGLQVTVSNGAGESVTVNGGAPAAQAGALVTVASIANAQTLGLHTYDIIVTSSTGNVVTLNITYTVTADVVTPTVTLIGAGVLPIYSVSAADTRFASGVQFTVTNDASITVNGASATSVAGTLTAASNAEAKTVGAHSYLVVVTSSTSQTASLQVTYQVVATTVTPSVTLSGAAIVSSYTATAALARFGGAGLQVTVSNGAGESVTVNGGAPAAQAGALVTVASIANAQTLGLHTYDIIVTSSTGNVVTLNITYTVTADVVTPTVTLIGAGVLPIYSVSAADTRFASGVQFTVTNDASITVNGASATSVAGTLTAASNAEAKTVGAHSYLVVVTSSTSQTASLQVTYQVVATTVTPSVTLSGAAIVSSYTATAALARFGGAGLQVTVSNGAGESVTVNGGAPAAQAGALVTVASIANAQTLGLHTYDIIVTSSTGNVVTLNITYTVTADAIVPVIPTIAKVAADAAFVSTYTEAAANSRFAAGVQFDVTGITVVSQATVNGGAAVSLAGGVLTAASRASAVTVGAHSYNVVVTSSTGHTASIVVTYQVTTDVVTPAIALVGGDLAVLPTYTATAAGVRFGGTGLRYTLTNANAVTVNGLDASAWIGGGTLTIPGANAVGTHAYDIIVRSTTGNFATLNVVYTVTADAQTPTIVLNGPALVSTYSVTEANTRFNNVADGNTLGLIYAIGNYASVTVNGADGSVGGGVLTVADNTTAGAPGLHTYDIILISTTGSMVTLNVTYQVNADAIVPIIPTIAKKAADADFVSTYTLTEALSRFAAGVRFDVTNITLVSQAKVNGGAAVSLVGGVLTAASGPSVLTVGAHSYNVVVTSTTGNTASIQVTYQVTTDVIIPTAALVGAAVLPIYSVSAADARFASGVQFTVSNAPEETVTVNGLAPVAQVGTLVTAASNTNAKTVGAHSYLIVVTSATGQTVSMLVTYQVVLDPSAVISNVLISSISSTGATITWTTSVASSSNSVDYGTTYAMTANRTTSTGDGVTSHSASLVGLTANSTYYFRINSTANGSVTNAGPYAFFTPAADTGIQASVQTLKSSATADNTYANGWEFKFNITVNNPAETSLKMQFNDWFGTGGTMLAAGNMKIGLVDDANLAVAVGNSYAAQTTFLTLVDENPNVGGIQETIYVFVKVPAGTSGGSFSTSYGIHTQ